jgi:hypothetical protein
MGTLFGFVVGYVLGARAGAQGFEEVVESLRDIRRSDEFRGFVDAMKSHSRHVLGQITGRLAGDLPVQDDYAYPGEDYRPRTGF